ncbi:MAG: hypothetical protein HY316_10870 [Acidobacteria bacterium]|nr:hypothetical protein [Acidobacteriota bacterium]
MLARETEVEGGMVVGTGSIVTCCFHDLPQRGDHHRPAAIESQCREDADHRAERDGVRRADPAGRDRGMNAKHLRNIFSCPPRA